MSAPVDVLAVLSGAATQCEARACRNHPDRAPYQVTAEMAESARATFLRMESELREARAAVAELVAADLEYDAACIHVGEVMFGSREQRKLAAERSARSNFRRIAAIARVKGGSA